MAGTGLAASLALAGAAVWLMAGEPPTAPPADQPERPAVHPASVTPPLDEPDLLPGDPALADASTTMEPASQPEQLAAGILAIPSLGIKAPIVPVTIQNPRSPVPEVPVPDDPATVGISTAGAQPCSAEGTTLLVGHVSRYRVKGALWPLAGVTSDTELFIRCADGSLATYRAAGPPAAPTKQDLDPGINTTTGPHRLVVVTCGGPVLPDGHYRDNVVATFTLVATD